MNRIHKVYFRCALSLSFVLFIVHYSVMAAAADSPIQYAQNNYAYLKWSFLPPDWVVNLGNVKVKNIQIYRNGSLIHTSAETITMYEDTTLGSIDPHIEVEYKVMYNVTYGSDNLQETQYEQASGTIPLVVIPVPSGSIQPEEKIRQTFGRMDKQISLALPSGTTVMCDVTLSSETELKISEKTTVYVLRKDAARYGLDSQGTVKGEGATIRLMSDCYLNNITLHQCSITPVIEPKTTDLTSLVSITYSGNVFLMSCFLSNIQLTAYKAVTFYYSFITANSCRFSCVSTKGEFSYGTFTQCEFHLDNCSSPSDDGVLFGGTRNNSPNENNPGIYNKCTFTATGTSFFKTQSVAFNDSNFDLDSGVYFMDTEVNGASRIVVSPDHAAYFKWCYFKVQKEMGDWVENRNRLQLICKGTLGEFSGTFFGGTIETPHFVMSSSKTPSFNLLQSCVITDYLEIENCTSRANEFIVQKEITGLNSAYVPNVLFNEEGVYGMPSRERAVGGQIIYSGSSVVDFRQCTFNRTPFRFSLTESSVQLNWIDCKLSYSKLSLGRVKSITLTGNSFYKSEIDLSNASKILCDTNKFFTKGYALDETEWDFRGLKVDSCHQVRIVHNDFTDFRDNFALELSASDGEINNNTFTNCQEGGLVCRTGDWYSMYGDDLSPILDIHDNKFTSGLLTLSDSQKVDIHDNIFESFLFNGVKVDNSKLFTISKNTFEQRNCAILLENCESASVANNTCAGYGDGVGIQVTQGKNNAIRENQVSNYLYGIFVLLADNVLVRDNKALGNKTAGIMVGRNALDSTTNTQVYNNWSANTAAGGENAVNYGTNTTWSLSAPAYGQSIAGGNFQGGNYWDDYTGVDTNGDGIGDTPYTIQVGGTVMGQDYYPLVIPKEAPTPTPLPTATPTPRPAGIVVSASVTDDATSTIDLSNSVDYDLADQRELCIRWNFVPPLESVKSYTLEIAVNGGGFQTLASIPNPKESLYVWKYRSKYLEPFFLDGPQGPQFGKSYEFRITAVLEGKTVGPVYQEGVVLFMQLTDTLPTPTSTPPNTGVWDWKRMNN